MNEQRRNTPLNRSIEFDTSNMLSQLKKHIHTSLSVPCGIKSLPMNQPPRPPKHVHMHCTTNAHFSIKYPRGTPQQIHIASRISHIHIRYIYSDSLETATTPLKLYASATRCLARSGERFSLCGKLFRRARERRKAQRRRRRTAGSGANKKHEYDEKHHSHSTVSSHRYRIVSARHSFVVVVVVGFVVAVKNRHRKFY